MSWGFEKSLCVRRAAAGHSNTAGCNKHCGAVPPSASTMAYVSAASDTFADVRGFT
ncbi:MAG: hypothetical protein U1E15_09370 [Hyphomicrobiales bacterium]